MGAGNPSGAVVTGTKGSVAPGLGQKKLLAQALDPGVPEVAH